MRIESKQVQELTDQELIDLSSFWVRSLARTDGASHRLSLPPKFDDTDIVFSELIRRFKQKIV